MTHNNIQPTIDLTMGVYGRDLGHVSDDVTKVIDEFGKRAATAPGGPTIRRQAGRTAERLEDRAERRVYPDAGHVPQSGFGLIGASVLIYFLMVGLDKSWVVPLTVMSIVPLCLMGIMPMLYFTGTAVNVQSLLGFIFVVGIKVANTVLMTDFAQELRHPKA